MRQTISREKVLLTSDKAQFYLREWLALRGVRQLNEDNGYFYFRAKHSMRAISEYRVSIKPDSIGCYEVHKKAPGETVWQWDEMIPPDSSCFWEMMKS